MKKRLLITLSVAILLSSCNHLTQYAPVKTILNLRAFIDGRSQLVIKGDRCNWRHFEFDAPGRWEHGEAHQPTYLNRAAWEPVWPDIPDATNDTCNCDSSSYQGIPPLARTNQRVWLDIVQARGRVAVIQQPNADNGFTFIIEMDDNYLDGSEWYEINLSYIVGASTSIAGNPDDPLKMPEYPMPYFLREALLQRGLMEVYRSRPPYQQNDYIGWITRAKRAETQQKRLAQMLAELEAGDKYMNMAYRCKES